MAAPVGGTDSRASHNGDSGHWGVRQCDGRKAMETVATHHEAHDNDSGNNDLRSGESLKSCGADTHPDGVGSEIDVCPVLHCRGTG